MAVAVAWSKELDRSAVLSLLLRVTTGAAWIAALAMSISWKDFTQTLSAVGLPAWLISFIDESVASALLLFRGLTDSRESVLQRFGKSGFFSVPWVLATGLDQGFTRIRASQEARALRLAVTPESTLPAFHLPKEESRQTPALEARTISVTDQESGHGIIKNIAFELGNGEWLGVFGASGSGKTTLLRTLSGLTPVTSGTISLLGREHRERTPYSEVGFVFQNPQHSVIGATAWEDACLGPVSRQVPKEKAETRVCTLFSAFGMQDLMHRPVSRLSFGELKRLSLISALATEPKLLFCDEPTSGLDAISANQLIRALSSIADEEGISVLWASHDLHLLPKRLKRGIVLAEGELVQELYLAEPERDEDFWTQAGLWPVEHAMHAVTFSKGMR
jgi:energy-coupling factor transporter ATP-binding protein EcfA2